MGLNARVEKAESGKPTLVIEAQGRKYAVYSRRDPERDGQRFYRENFGESADLYFFIGIGLGYHIAPFVQDPRVKRVVVLEPEETLFQTVRNFEKVRFMVEHEKVQIFRGAEMHRFLNSVDGCYDYLYYSGFRLLAYPPLLKPPGSSYGTVEVLLHEKLRALVNDGATIGRFAALWVNNFFRNLGRAARVFPVSALYGSSSGSALITGAGPSLAGVLGDIERRRRGFYIIATDASLKPLLCSGIKPDIIASVDPQPGVFHHLSGLSNAVIADIPVVLNPLCNPLLYNLFDRRYLYCTQHPLMMLLGELCTVNPRMVINYEAVSSLACHLAIRMGFETIVFAGLDFYYTGMRAYAQNTFFYEYCINHAVRLRTPLGMELEQLVGRRGIKLEDYRRELQSVISSSETNREIEFYNWRSGGRDIEGTMRTTSLPRGKPALVGESPGCRPMALPHPASLCSSKHLPRVMETLSLRRRIYHHASSRREAAEQAFEFLKKKCDLYERDLKFEIQCSDK
jgi:hypothetical protein